MRAASTGGGLVCLVVIWLVVLAALVMTAAGASSTSAVAAAASATVTATVTVTAATAVHKAAAGSSPTSMSSEGSAATANGRASAADNVTAIARDLACEEVRVSIREPACTSQISEGPGPPLPHSRCPTAKASCTNIISDNNITNNNNNYNINNNFNDNNNNENGINNNYNNNNNNNNSNHQCLEYARRELIPTMCPDDPGAYRRPGRLSRYRLRHCCHHTVESAVQRPYTDKQSCEHQVNEALYMDDIAAAMSCQFDEVLARYDCQQKYSAKSCDSCKDAYALWACAAVLPHWTRSTAERGRRWYRVNACQSVCLEAEQKCPWLLPVADDGVPYAGEASFTCIDPDIGYQMSSTGAKKDCCYEHCADGLCVRNASLCDGGGGGPRREDGGGGGESTAAADQRPLCVKSVALPVDESECTDYYGQTDSSSRPAAGALLLLVVSALRAAAAVT